jgi:hypothetical protein
MGCPCRMNLDGETMPQKPKPPRPPKPPPPPPPEPLPPVHAQPSPRPVPAPGRSFSQSDRMASTLPSIHAHPPTAGRWTRIGG